MEDNRLQVINKQILEYFAALYSIVNGITAHFVMNMDEMGHQPYADAKDTTCLAPSTHPEATVNYPVSRVGKRITLLACIFADGSFIRPALVIPENVDIYSQGKGYVDQDIFEDWTKDTLVPELQRRTAAMGCPGPAILILDNCSAHKGLEFEKLCQDNNIKCVFLPPHASHLLQMLDLSIFGATTRLIARMNENNFHDVQNNHIVKILDSFISARAPNKIVESFRLGGLSLLMEEGTRIIRCLVTPETARRVLYVFRDERLRFHMEDIDDDDENEIEDDMEETEEEKENVRMIVQEIRRALGA
jgi:hypothetical protein